MLAKILIFLSIVCKHHILNFWSKVIRLNGIRNWEASVSWLCGLVSKFDRFQKEKKTKSPDLYDKVQEVAKNIEEFRFFFYFHI
jgi:hypothetical protein